MMLSAAPPLRRFVHKEGMPIYIIVYMSLIKIGWIFHQEDEEGGQYAKRFNFKVLSEQQRKYASVKRKLWGITPMMKVYKGYLIGTTVVIEMDGLPILGKISGCTTLGLAILRWIVYIKSMNLEVHHISGKNNVMADMLLRVRYKGESDIMLEDKDVSFEFVKEANAIAREQIAKYSTPSTKVNMKGMATY